MSSLLLLFQGDGAPAGATLVMEDGIASGEAIGADGKISLRLGAAAGIATGEAFGAGAKINLQLIVAAGITSEEFFGADSRVSFRLAAVAGIASGEAFGAGPALCLRLVGDAGIASAEAFGDGGAVTDPGGAAPATLSMSSGIASAEVFGGGGYIGGEEQHPAPDVAPTYGAGFASSSASRRDSRAFVNVLAGERGIASTERFGAHGAIIRLQKRIGMPAGIAAPVRVRGERGLPAPHAFGFGGAIRHRSPPPWLLEA